MPHSKAIPATTDSKGDYSRVHLTNTEFSFSTCHEHELPVIRKHIFTAKVPSYFSGFSFYYYNYGFHTWTELGYVELEPFSASKHKILKRCAFKSKKKLIDFAIAKIVECMSDKEIKKYFKK